MKYKVVERSRGRELPVDDAVHTTTSAKLIAKARLASTADHLRKHAPEGARVVTGPTGVEGERAVVLVGHDVEIESVIAIVPDTGGTGGYT